MNKLILGIGTFGHDSSAALVNAENGEILYCLTEERFSNQKHDGRFPHACISELLSVIEKKSLGHLAYIGLNFQYESFVTKMLFQYLDTTITDAQACEKIKITLKECLTATAIFEQGKYPLNYLVKLMTSLKLTEETQIDLCRKIKWYGNWAIRYRTFYEYIKAKFSGLNIIAVPHHDCHAASTFYASGFENAAILTIDGHGEFEAISLKIGNLNDIKDISATPWPYSLGILYYDFTEFLGFTGLGNEYKVMGMAAYGTLKYLDLFRTLGKVNPDGTFEFIESILIKLTEHPGCHGHFKFTITPVFEELLGGRKNPQEKFSQRHFDIACSLQKYIEETATKIASCLKKACPETNNLCLAGGVALNGLMNMRIYQEAGFKNIFIQPAAGDDGTSLGAALWIYNNVIEKNQKSLPSQKMQNAFLGLEYDSHNILQSINTLGVQYIESPNIHDDIAELLAAGKIVARYTGRSEFGPRALGHRSILASPLSKEMKDVLNERIKHREMFRPFAPACLSEHAFKYFDISCIAEYMLLICKVRPEKASLIPAVVHQDGTARLQSVTSESNEDFHKILQCFMKLTSVPVVMNTSFNINGETIVETPQDALECFLYTDIDFLAMENYLISKTANVSATLNLPIDQFLLRRRNRYLQKYLHHELYLCATEFLGL